MNALSWLIYAAEIGPRLGNGAGGIAMAALLVGFAMGLQLFFYTAETENEVPGFAKPLFKTLAAVIVAGSLVYGLMPSRQTILLIAASEIGERVLASDKMARVEERVNGVLDPSLDLLTTWMIKQTQDLRQQMAAAPEPKKK